jgi:hypothetical protein
MGVSYEYDASIDELMSDLKKLKKRFGGDARVQKTNPGYWDPHFDGHNSRLKIKYSKHQDRIIIVEEAEK